MNKYFIYSLLLAMAGMTFTACSEDKLDSTSVIQPDETGNSEFDKWLDANFVAPYNIEFLYRYKDNETDMNYFNIPAKVEDAVKLAHIVKYSCLEAYDQVAGVNFTRAYFPKMFYAVGDFEFKNNGTMILGTAEGGKKIFLAGTNHLDKFLRSREELNTYYLKTIHHEFTHIMNQTKDYPANFKLITGTGYVSDAWSQEPYWKPEYYLKHGFISAYAQHSHVEDFAEMLSIYITNPKTQWDAWMPEAGTDGAKLIQQKLDIVRSYMKTQWKIDLDKLRDTVLQREDDIVAGRVNLTDLTVNH